MARPPKLDPFQAALQEFSRQIAEKLAEGISRGLEASLARAGVRGGSAPVQGRGRGTGAGEGSCRVPGCGRTQAAKGLCMNHYGKARRLKLDVGSLGAQDLDTLARDLRGARA